VIFAWEKVENVWDEAMALARDNAKETGVLGIDEFDPDKERFQQLCETGALVVFTARQDGKLVGYFVVHLFRHLIFSKTIWAIQDSLYIDPGHRGLAAVRFLKWTDSALKDLGVDCILRQVTTQNDYSRTLERLGYALVERGYVRRI
jgi:GNAT superfamily N-acetyltransferase